jgi:hypothetical protein
MGDMIRPINRATYAPPRIHLNLTNPQELAKALEAATPAAEAWETDLPPNVMAAFVSAGVLTTESSAADWAACTAALAEAPEFENSMNSDI